MRFNLILLMIAFTLLFLIEPHLAFAPPPPPPPQEIPIDGGLGALLVAGLIYGGKKLRDEKKAQ